MRKPTRKTCGRCGLVLPLGDFYRSTGGGHGLSWMCRTCTAGWVREYRARQKAAGIVPPYTLAQRYSMVRTNALKRKISFLLTKEQAAALWQQPCDYCGAATADLNVDRVDNTKGYELGNVVPCCTPCNRAKHTLTRDAFLAHVERIYEHSVARRPTTP